MTVNKNQLNLAMQFTKFGMVGLTNTGLSLLVYYGLYNLGIHYLIANAVGFAVGVINSYYWNNRYVFKKTKEGHLIPFVKTFLCYGFTFLLSTLLLYVMVDYLFWSELIAPLINLAITVPINFVLNKIWAFK